MKQNTGFCFNYEIGGDWMYDKSGQRKYLNFEERKAFLGAVQREPDLLKRSFCLTLFYSGCRISEALALTWDQIDFSEQLIVFETLKQRKSGVFRPVLVPDTLIILFENQDRATNPIWRFSRTTAWRIVKKSMASAKIKGSKASPKGLRHSFAVSYIENGVPITSVQKWLGHKRIETTAIYLNTLGKEERSLASRIWS